MTEIKIDWKSWSLLRKIVEATLELRAKKYKGQKLFNC